MNPQDPLSQLHPLRDPVAIGWWPLAPGWWLLLGLMVLVLAIAVFLWAVKSEQFEDLDRQGHNILFEDDMPSESDKDAKH